MLWQDPATISINLNVHPPEKIKIFSTYDTQNVFA